MVDRVVPFALEPIETSRDGRGWVSNLLDFMPLPPDRIGNIHVAELKPGAVRGNHVHRRQTEWVVICGGPVRVTVEADGQRHDRILPGDQPMLLTVRPGAAHALRSEGAARVHLVAVTDMPYAFAHPDVETVHLLSPEDRHEA